MTTVTITQLQYCSRFSHQPNFETVNTGTLLFQTEKELCNTQYRKLESHIKNTHAMLMNAY